MVTSSSITGRETTDATVPLQLVDHRQANWLGAAPTLSGPADAAAQLRATSRYVPCFPTACKTSLAAVSSPSEHQTSKAAASSGPCRRWRSDLRNRPNRQASRAPLLAIAVGVLVHDPCAARPLLSQGRPSHESGAPSLFVVCNQARARHGRRLPACSARPTLAQRQPAHPHTPHSHLELP